MPVYRLSAAAADDIVRLLAHSERHFGAPSRGRYEALLVCALRDIAADPHRPGTAARPELGPGVRSFHLRYSRDRAAAIDARVARPCHFILYRVIGPDLIGVGRVLHDGMEVSRHLPALFGDE